MITLKLGTTASLRFENAINESQALEQLKSACPQFIRGSLKEYGWREGINRETGFGELVRDESKDEYYEPEIKLIEQ